MLYLHKGTPNLIGSQHRDGSARRWIPRQLIKLARGRTMDVGGLSASLQEFFVGLVLRDGRRPPVGALAVGLHDTSRARFDVDGSRR